MWLTGFDVPSLHTSYVDKPMRDHGLMQAIARVNRVFRDKPGWPRRGLHRHRGVVADDETKKRFLREDKLSARWLALVNPHAAAIELKHYAEFFGAVASNVLKYTPPDEQASVEAKHVVSQFFSEGLAAGEAVDVFELAGEDRPRARSGG
jgi:hypothetical protein